MKQMREYPAKIMLVGEYAVILGGSALTIPFPAFRAIIRSVDDIPPGKEKLLQQSLAYLRKIHEYLEGIPAGKFHASPDLEHFAKNLHSRWLDLNIPIGYGLGSSGTVSAAVYDLYFQGVDALSLQQKKEDLALIESFFHGKSSGVDALSCHAAVALHFHGSGEIEKPDFNPSDIAGNYRFFLLNSGERFDTGPLVKHFLGLMKDEGFKHAMEEDYLGLNQLLLDALLGKRDADAGMLVRMLSDFQLRHFRKMIPEKAVDLWIEGLVTNEYYMKLNGSGGGMMLGITHETSRESLEDRWADKLLWIG
jgi:mevalonate kinase